VQIRRYWDLDFRDKHEMGFDETLDELDRQLTETVRYHLVSDVPVGAFLSGGVDSSLVVAMMSKITGGGFKTFSGDVPYGEYSEMPYSRLVAQRYGTDARELTIVPSLVRTLPDLVWHLDEPSDPLSTCMYYISQLARRDVKVVLGGDGGDELFGGYDRYYGNVYVSLYAMIPETLRRTVMERLLRMMPEGYWYRSASHKLRWIHQMSFYRGGERYAKSLGYFYFSDRFRESLYTASFRDAVAMFDPEESIRRHFDGANADDVIDRMLYTDAMTRLQDHPVMILDRMTMAHSLEARSPFMDHRLAEFCAAIPARYKVKGRTLRYVQMELARRYLPEQILTRKKQGFSSALTYLLADEFRLLYRLLLHDSHLAQAGIVRNDTVEGLLNEHLEGRADHGQRMWQLCNAEIWYRMYIAGEHPDSLQALIASQAQREGLSGEGRGSPSRRSG
jgi:asparagine synthase (glutamine-hydrolysing)